ncbi:hypothetical protein NL524_30840, partial [Klebsiella pneumoniae]|nr:hypothetical protein [Klebsiella pneumoniae]
SWGGMRTVPAKQCQRMEASRYYSCLIDGELVTPWSGQQVASEVVGGKPLETAKSVGSEPLESVQKAVPVVPATSGAT